MKSTSYLPYFLLFGVMISSTAFLHLPQQHLAGAWHVTTDGVDEVLIFQDGYFTHTVYNKTGKKFLRTYGGPYTSNKATLSFTKEFDTQNNVEVGGGVQIPFVLYNHTLSLDLNGKQVNFKQLDAGAGDLSGAWKITGRKQEGAIMQIHQTGPRKTLKILSDSRFQWAAINPATKEFFGTGGGSYTFVDGKYTEHIEFFSRDSSRVGASLIFNGQLINGNWHHSGKSSKGDDIYEVWSRINTEN